MGSPSPSPSPSSSSSKVLFSLEKNSNHCSQRRRGEKERQNGALAMAEIEIVLGFSAPLVRGNCRRNFSPVGSASALANAAQLYAPTLHPPLSPNVCKATRENVLSEKKKGSYAAVFSIRVPAGIGDDDRGRAPRPEPVCEQKKAARPRAREALGDEERKVGVVPKGAPPGARKRALSAAEGATSRQPARPPRRRRPPPRACAPPLDRQRAGSGRRRVQTPYPRRRRGRQRGLKRSPARVNQVPRTQKANEGRGERGPTLGRSPPR